MKSLTSQLRSNAPPGAAHLGLGQALAEPAAHEVARAGPRLDQPAAFQQVVGLGHGDRADAVDAAGLAHRGQALAGAEHAVGDQRGGLVGEVVVAAHPPMVHGAAGVAGDQPWPVSASAATARFPARSSR